MNEFEFLAKDKNYALSACFQKDNRHIQAWTDYKKGSIIFTSIDISEFAKSRPIFYALNNEFEAYKLECPETDFRLHYGPISSGLWESGAFDILSYGERILNITIDIGYKHREIEKRVIGKNINDAILLIERLCGNFSVSYSTAFCKALESLTETEIPEKAKYIRAIALELERLYNHFYVIQRLATAASQKVAISHFSALVEEILRLNAKIFGHRYIFGLNLVGGVMKDIKADLLLIKIDEIEKDFEELINILLYSSIFIDRLHKTAVLSRNDVIRMDTIGIAAKASGVKRDVRMFDRLYSKSKFRVMTEKDGDALARLVVRIMEVRNSFEIIRHLTKNIPQTELKTELKLSNGFCYERAEAPPGDILIAIEVENNTIKWAGIRPPSLINYVAFANAVVGNIFTDFPFAIESFGLSFADSDR